LKSVVELGILKFEEEIVLYFHLEL